jgi:hypothetical protein
LVKRETTFRTPVANLQIEYFLSNMQIYSATVSFPTPLFPEIPINIGVFFEIVHLKKKSKKFIKAKKNISRKKHTRMNTIQRHVMIGFGLAIFILYVSLITVTLLVTYQVYNNDINQSMVKFVEVGNWIIVSVLILFVSVGIVVWKFRKIDLKLPSSDIHPASYSV